MWGTTPKEAARLADALALRLIQAAARKEVPRIVVGPKRLPHPTGFADRAVDALPGPFPGRAEPVWAGFAGFVIALLAWTSIILIRSEGGPWLRVETRAARESRQESREPLG